MFLNIYLTDKKNKQFKQFVSFFFPFPLLEIFAFHSQNIWLPETTGNLKYLRAIRWKMKNSAVLFSTSAPSQLGMLCMALLFSRCEQREDMFTWTSVEMKCDGVVVATTIFALRHNCIIHAYC